MAAVSGTAPAVNRPCSISVGGRQPYADRPQPEVSDVETQIPAAESVGRLRRMSDGHARRADSIT